MAVARYATGLGRYPTIHYELEHEWGERMKQKEGEETQERGIGMRREVIVLA